MPVSEIVHSEPVSTPTPAPKPDISDKVRQEFDAILRSHHISGDKARRMTEIMQEAEWVIGPQNAEFIRQKRRESDACVMSEDKAACFVDIVFAFQNTPYPNAISIITYGPC